MEMITSNKSDHRDLARTHVWGCPRYVLEPKLQNNQELPKWNRQARMGQFPGYSRFHSSTVALVRNLHTGHVIPQYHLVFDDKFETVFSGGKSEEEMDKIFQKLFDGERENYVEEEYDDDGVLIYEPPPLDEVWLSEPERRDRQDALRRQRRPPPPRPLVLPPPLLVRSWSPSPWSPPPLPSRPPPPSPQLCVRPQPYFCDRPQPI